MVSSHILIIMGIFICMLQMCGYMNADMSVPWYVCRGHREPLAAAPLLIQSLLPLILLCVPGWLVWERPGILLNLPRLTLAVLGLQMIPHLTLYRV